MNFCTLFRNNRVFHAIHASTSIFGAILPELIHQKALEYLAAFPDARKSRNLKDFKDPGGIRDIMLQFAERHYLSSIADLKF